MGDSLGYILLSEPNQVWEGITRRASSFFTSTPDSSDTGNAWLFTMMTNMYSVNDRGKGIALRADTDT